jgi:YggT family protein
MTPDLLHRALYSVLTLYMLLILVRWFGPYLELDLYAPRLRWIARVTDPFVSLLRRTLPPLGPMDLAPLLSVLLMWLVRDLTLAALMR